MSLFVAFEANSFRDRLAVLGAQGRNVVSFTSATPDQPAVISRASCERMVAMAGVQRAGLLVGGKSTPVMQLGQAVAVVEASTTLFPQLRDHQALIGSALSQPERGGRVTTGLGVLQSTPAQPQPEGLSTNSGLVILLQPTVTAGELCVAVLEPYAKAETLIPRLAAQLDARGGAIVGLESTKQTMDPVALYLERITRFLPLLLGLSGALIAGLANQLRASELAVYRLSGTSRRSLAVILFLEQALIAGLGLLAASGALILTAAHLISTPASFAWVAAGFTFWVVIANLLSIPVIMRSTLSMAKDR